MKEIEQERFTETQAFPLWSYALLGVSSILSLGSLLAVSQVAPKLWLWCAASLGLVFNLLCVRTQVSSREVRVTFGVLFPLYRRRIALGDIASAEAVTYSPLVEYGGWGIRGWGGNVALNARGNRGVRLTLRDGKRLLIGSQRPQELAEALQPPGPQ